MQNKIGIWTVSTFIIGFPHETPETVQTTIDFAVTSQLDFAVFYLPMPFPATPLTKIYMQENLLEINSDEEWGLLMSGTGGIATKHFTADELQALQQSAYKQFMRSVAIGYLKNPMRVVHKIRNIEDLLYALKMGLNLVSIAFEQSKFGRLKGYRPLGMRHGGQKDMKSQSPLNDAGEEARALPERLTDQVYGRSHKRD